MLKNRSFLVFVEYSLFLKIIPSIFFPLNFLLFYWRNEISIFNNLFLLLLLRNTFYNWFENSVAVKFTKFRILVN